MPDPIDALLSMSSKETALFVLRSAPEVVRAESGRLSAEERANNHIVDPSAVEHDDQQLCNALELLAAWQEPRFCDVVWVYAHALERLHKSSEHLERFRDLQHMILSSIDCWSIHQNDQLAGFAELLASSLIEIDAILLDRHGIGSRAIIGSVLLLHPEGKQLLRLKRGKECRYGLEEIRTTCRLGADVLSAAKPLIQVLSEQQPQLACVRSMHLLCNPLVINDVVHNRLQWCEYDAIMPHSELLLRLDEEVVGRLGEHECDQVLSDVFEN